jgi:dynein heavy chain 2
VVPLQEDTSWVAMKTFLGKRSVKEDILNYDAHRILTTPGAACSIAKAACNLFDTSCTS